MPVCFWSIVLKMALFIGQQGQRGDWSAGIDKKRGQPTPRSLIRRQSSVAPVSLATLPHLTPSALTKAAKLSGVSPT